MPAYLVNGEPNQSVNVSDRGLCYGDGLFETILFSNGTLRFWPEHIQRLNDGCVRLGLPIPDAELLKKEVLSLVENTQRPAVIKIIWTRGEGIRGYTPPNPCQPTRIISYDSQLPNYEKTLRQGARLMLCQTQLAKQPLLAGIKHLNRLENVLAKQEVSKENFDEGVLCNTDGSVISATTANIYLVKNNQVFTPTLEECGIKGVMRHHILALLKKWQTPAIEKQIKVEALIDAEEIFISNTLLGVCWVSQLKNKKYGLGKLTKQLIQTIK